MSSSEWNGDLQGDQIYLFGNAQSAYKVKATVYYDIDQLDKYTDHGPTDFKDIDLSAGSSGKIFFRLRK